MCLLVFIMIKHYSSAVKIKWKQLGCKYTVLGFFLIGFFCCCKRIIHHVIFCTIFIPKYKLQYKKKGNIQTRYGHSFTNSCHCHIALCYKIMMLKPTPRHSSSVSGPLVDRKTDVWRTIFIIWLEWKDSYWDNTADKQWNDLLRSILLAWFRRADSVQ